VVKFSVQLIGSNWNLELCTKLQYTFPDPAISIQDHLFSITFSTDSTVVLASSSTAERPPQFNRAVVHSFKEACDLLKEQFENLEMVVDDFYCEGKPVSHTIHFVANRDTTYDLRKLICLLQTVFISVNGVETLLTKNLSITYHNISITV